jgi:ABC-type transport system involved in Fe-S cluster assembly fused permease/ATPase subunit
MQGRTTLMIAHRLSTLDVCDARIEIVNGRIARAVGKITHAGLQTPDDQQIRAAKWVN